MRRKNILLLTICLYASINIFVMLDGLLAPAAAQPAYTIDEVTVNSERVDVRGQAVFGVHVVRTSDEFPLQFGKLTFLNRPGEWYTDYYGWCIVPVTSWTAQNFSLQVDKIYSGAAELTYQQTVPDPWCVFDQVSVDLKTSKPRIGVNTDASIRWTAVYGFDGTPFEGEIILNEELSNPAVGNRTYEVVEIVDEKYGLTEFETDSLVIISDRVLVTLNASAERVNVGDEAEIEWTATYEYDQTPFHGWIDFNDTLVQEEAGKYRYTVGSVGDAWYDVTSFSSNCVDIIFDEVNIKVRADRVRVDVGDEVEVTLHARYSYNSEPFEGDLTLNSDDFRMNSVGSRKYFVEEIEDPIYGLTSFSSEELEVTWDRVNLELEASDDRISVGDQAEILWTGTYASDGSPFNGEIELSPDVSNLDSVGDVVYEVASIDDTIYGISEFTSNSVEVVWDRVDVSLIFPYGRTEVGTEPDLTIEAFYEYDDRKFAGTVNLNGSLVKSSVGKRWFTVSSIDDPRYGITSFVSNEASCIWDNVLVEERVVSNLPGSVEVEFKLSNEYDGSPVRNANVYVNGKPCSEVEAGTYVKRVINLLPVFPMRAELGQPGFSGVISLGTHLSIGNMGIYAVVLLAIAVFFARGRLTNVLSRGTPGVGK